MNYSIFTGKKGNWYLLALFFIFVDIGGRADSKEAFRFACPPNPVFFSRFRQFSPIFCAVLLLVGNGGSVLYAQSTTNNQHNRNVRETRSNLSANAAAAMVKDMQTSYKNLPWNELPPAVQVKIKSVVSGASLFHRMPQQTICADPEIYQFMVRHPDLVIGFWEQLGATQLSLREVRDNRFILKEPSDTAAVIDVLYRTSNICIAYAKGDYRGPLLARSYQGEVIIVLRSRFARDAMGEPLVVCDLDTFIQIDNVGADVLAKLFFASITRIADSNFEITTSFVSQVSHAASHNPATLKGMAGEITSVHPEIHEEFCDLVDRVEARFAHRNQPKPFEISQQQIQFEKPERAQPHDFSFSMIPPTDWEMDHFLGFSQTPYTALHYENRSELIIPKSLGPPSTGYNFIPRLPKQIK